MAVQNNLQSTYQNYIEMQKAQQAKLAEQAKGVANPQVREYLEASNKLMNQLNQLDEFVLSTTQQKKTSRIFRKSKMCF